MQDAGYGLPRTPLLLGTWVNRRCILRHWTKLPLPTLGSNTYIYEKSPKAPQLEPRVLPRKGVIRQMHELFLCAKCLVGGVGRASSWAAHLPGFVLPAPLLYQAYASSEQCTSSILPIFSAMAPVLTGQNLVHCGHITQVLRAACDGYMPPVTK
jgi:hypothetical protein